MLIVPAIDLLGGNVVRLYKGRRESAKVYSNAPDEIARAFVQAGAKLVHVVDLDAAFGDGDNRATISAIAATGAEVQAGGGVRDAATACALYDAGARAIVLGTSAVKQPELVRSLCKEFPGTVVVAVDAHGDKVAVEGWSEKTEIEANDLAARAVEWGAAAILYTDITRDGTGVGPNVEATAELARALHPVPVIASGGIGSLEHLRALARAGVPQAIVGRALYENKFTLGEAFEAAGHV
ncbi:MAG TPA: 1-(5-phosphoribosyl)-5-[(5-phosphoribosylamino)methylideneamino]imidazole-4-carboxamide isomerase [Polyangia bacterium]|nr:1-(5-phosphoribosyl)-5-[(5-phosphoribosylamino)methylideneamino]imidazole-4-carboxamide isomerase [Polyangia bacterium]